ncbi:putative ribonuclease H-like domain-containing protein [Tanacetum coccineum]
MVPRTILTRSGPISLHTARPVNTVQTRSTVNNARHVQNIFNNAYSTVRRPFNKVTAANNSNFNKKVNIVKGTRVNTARPKAVFSVVNGNKGNAVKASTCWVWKLKHKVLDHVSRHNGNPQQDLKDKGVIDSRCSRHMIGNRSYLTDYEENDGGFVAFRGNSKGGKITGKDFKLTAESYVLLKVPRKDNMYNVDLKNVIPQGGLTCLFVKATSDESNLWHRRLGHVNFKTINKLVKGNLGIKREFSIARTQQQNGVAKRKNRTLIEAARTMLADSKLLTTFWAEAVNTACYVLNRVLVIKPHNKTPCELFLGRERALRFMRPFGCPVTILNNIDHLGNGLNWLFDIDALTKSMNYKPIVAGNQSNGNVDPHLSSSSKDSPNPGFKPSGEEEKKDAKDPRNESENPPVGKDSEVPSTEESRDDQDKEPNVNSTNSINTVSSHVNAGGSTYINVDGSNWINAAEYPDDPRMPNLEDIASSENEVVFSAEADMTNLDTVIPISPIQTTRIHKDHPVEKIIRDIHSAPQTRRMTKNSQEHDLFSTVQQRTNHKDFQNCLFVCFLSQAEPKKVWTLVDLPHGKRAIGTKWVYRNKKDERDIVIRNKARVYKVEKALYGLHQALRVWYDTLSTYLLDNGFQRGKIDKTLFIRRDKGLEVQYKEDGIFISQDKYVTEILKNFGFTDVGTASTPMETHKPLLKDENGKDIDEHMYRSMIGSLMYLTSSRPDIIFAILISWQCKKQTVVANFTTEAEYVAASSCCGQVLWIENQLLDYGEGCLECNGKAAKDEIGIKAVKYN